MLVAFFGVVLFISSGAGRILPAENWWNLKGWSMRGTFITCATCCISVCQHHKAPTFVSLLAFPWCLPPRMIQLGHVTVGCHICWKQNLVGWMWTFHQLVGGWWFIYRSPFWTNKHTKNAHGNMKIYERRKKKRKKNWSWKEVGQITTFIL